MNSIRPPAVAGTFYPASPAILKQDVAQLLASTAVRPSEATQPKALIVPHAGYIYSGQTAAEAYALLRPYADRIRRVVLLGPAHRVAVKGLALPSVASFATPLGSIELDQAACTRLQQLPQIVISDAAHAAEHSLEVQLPFLQKMLGSFTLVPLAVGDASAQDVAAVLEQLWGGPETLIVVSSDLSHFHRYDDARRIDDHTVQTILQGRLLHSYEQACGAAPINGLLHIAPAHGLTARLISSCNSGDSAGDRSRVVGYASFVFAESAAAPSVDSNDQANGFSDEQGDALLAMARAHIAAALGETGMEPMEPIEPGQAAWLDEAGAVFVTLKKDGELRGCIGSLQAHRALADDLKANALAAAFRDPRFPPVTVDELTELEIEVSVIGVSQPMAHGSEADALAQLEPMVDGVILEYGQHRSTFLPQVWEQLPDRRQFMAHLKVKAGLPHDFWSPQIRLARYRVEKWSETTVKEGSCD